mmetsp:Transcript_35536/g.59326  ORF Transcript_35536/g.59326 Transcript_35536/m.59326 type:complete len:278 (+) Transcript_35536:87-920(+)
MSDEKRDEKEVELFVHLLRCKTFESIADHPKTVSVRASAAWVFTDLDTVINSLQAVRDLARDSQRFSVRLHSARPTDRTEIRSDTSILADSKPALITDITDAVVKSGLSAIPGVVGRSAEFPLFVEVGVMRLYIHGLLKGLFGVTKIGTMFELNISEDHSILKLIAACDLPEFSLLEKSIFDRDPCAGESPLDGSLKLWRLCRGWKIERPLFLLAEPHTMYQKMKNHSRMSLMIGFLVLAMITSGVLMIWFPWQARVLVGLFVLLLGPLLWLLKQPP